jgi:hypothetical protein
MLLILLLFLYAVLISANANDIIVKLRHELELSKTVDYDPVIPFLCTVLPSFEFKTTNDQYLIHSILNELGFGIVGVRQGSWASKYQTNPYRRPSCTPAMQSISTSQISKISTVDLKKIIRSCCLSDHDL